MKKKNIFSGLLQVSQTEKSIIKKGRQVENIDPLQKYPVPHFNFRTKKCEIQTRSGPKFKENQTKSGTNLTLFRTGFTKNGLIRTLGQFYRFKATFQYRFI